jgi:hypothetical protein
MKKNSNAFIVIKSLTMSEKRYFKIFSERHTIGEQNKYVLLFDELDRAIVEDDKHIKQNLEKINVNTDYFSADKNYLYQLILKSLNAFHDSKTFNLELKELLISIEILFHKGLYESCLKLIVKAENLANTCENFQLMIDILTWKKKCCGYSLGLNKASEVNKSIDQFITKTQDLKRIIDLYYESNILQSNNEQQNKKETIAAFDLILKQPILKSEKNILSFTGKTFYYLIYANYYNFINNKTKELSYLENLMALLNQSKTYALENPLDYISIYNRLLAIKKHFSSTNFLNDLIILKKFSENNFIRKEVVANRIFIHCHTHEIEYYLINNNFNDAIKKLNAFEKEISKTKLDIEPYHTIYFNYIHSMTLIFVGEFRKALKFNNQILNNFEFSARPQVYFRVKVLSVILHYELKNMSLVSTMARQILRENSFRNILIPLEIKILNSLIKISSSLLISPKELNSIFEQIQSFILDIKTDRKNSVNSMIENYEKWVISKIKRKLVCEVFK